MPPTSPSDDQGMSAPSRPQQGIDFNQAFEILAGRPIESRANQENHSAGCCNCHTATLDGAQSLGQKIDLTSLNLNEKDGSTTANESSISAENSKDDKLGKIRAARAERLSKMKDGLNSLTSKELIGAILQAQEERVTKYRAFDRGLATVLESGNMTHYPAICTEATASFSVLSDTINTIKQILAESHDRKDMRQLVERLQASEKEKLNLTAALHLEQIRGRSQQLELCGDERIAAMLQDGVQSLRVKIARCVETINEVLDEIRFAMMEEADT